MTLEIVWLLLVAVLWAGYLVLEGFDFGVGTLSAVLGRSEAERGQALETIGPVWDGNEVWVITAVGATFAAFPAWYASLLSAYYLPVLGILLALICRNVALEWREKRAEAWWRQRCDRVVAVASALPPPLWGLVLGGSLGGLPLNADGDLVGGPVAAITLPGVAGAVVVSVLSLAHGSAYLRLRITGRLRGAARRAAQPLAALAAVLTPLLAWWTVARAPEPTVVAVVAAGGLTVTAVAAAVLAWRHREGWSFALGTATIVLLVATWFGSVAPTVMPSTLDPAWDVTLSSAASGAYTLTLMTWVAAIFVPVVLGYQGWVYWTFRHRVEAPTAL